ncbi:odorant receptor 67c-like [Anticarsia gemmatalis]|uniref:odorant receptor 67c-like n=1 Tax=Anticarsia gemmatalis TaxID=129554 RepID=UPI003F763BE1
MSEPALLIDKTIKKYNYIFLSTGINVKAGEKTKKDILRSRFVFIFNFIWMNGDVVGAFLWFFTGLAQHKGFTELTYVSPCITISCLGNLKAYYMIVHEKTVDSLLNILRKLEIDQQNRRGTPETEIITATEHNYVNRVMKVLNIFYIILIICFGLNPLMLVLINYLTTNKVELLLPLLIVYPFDPFDLRYYPWVYLKQFWSDIVVILGIFAADFVFYVFCTYLRMQFRLLGYYLQQAVPSDQKTMTLLEIEATKLKIVDLVKWHQQLISSVAILDTLYTKSTLFNFVSSSLLLCLTGFNVMAINDVAFVISFLCFLMTSLLQIYFLCSFGDLLMESSIQVGDAVYNSNWYLADPAVSKMSLLIQTRSQRPCKLTALNFADVNLMAFMKICSTAWSYFALLQTLYTAPTK